MPCVPLKKMKNKINYTVRTSRNQICTVSMPLSSPHQQFCTVILSGAEIKESYFTGLKSKLFFVQKCKPELA